MKELDPLLHNHLRLAIMSLLVANEEVQFTYVVEQTEASRGNVSVQMNKLEDAGYLEVEKKFKGKKPQTSMKITPKGLDAMQRYTDALKDYLNL